MLILVGASASGKTATALNLQKRYGLIKAVTTTTRQMREGENNGIDYFFVDKEEFEKRIKKDKFVEHSIYNNNYYGCGRDQVADNKVIVLDPNGVKSFQNLHDSRVISILLTCNKETRKQRMQLRGDQSGKIIERLTNDIEDFSEDKTSNVDFIVDTSKKTIDEVTDEVYRLYQNKLK
mgnify:CR=1 FL=1